ncbi:hypothetical protein [Kytococcus sp. Marseille-QA3725]
MVADADPIEMQDLEARALADDLVQVFWISRRGGRRARRTSLWRRSDDRWRTIYHQGTPMA